MYQLSQICIYPDRDAANIAVKERLLAIRERIINGEKFSTLARIYSQDPGSARKGGELGLASKSIFWPAFSDAAMALKPGVVSQIVETPDGFHLIEVLEKKGDMFNARHILLKPEYTSEDREKQYHPSGLSQCTSPKHPVSCIEPGLATRLEYNFQDNLVLDIHPASASSD